MTVKTYHRPVGLCYGADAVQLIARRQAGRLGGHAEIGFLAVEVIRRSEAGLAREIVPYTDVPSDRLVLIEQLRPDFGGIVLDRPRIMGIVNVTPDSFSDGGQFETVAKAVHHGKSLLAEGADLLDVGGESTRPGSETVDDDTETDRVAPVVQQLSAAGFCVSVDTRKAKVMRASVAAGAAIINDVSALQYDKESLALTAQLQVPVILMHAKGEPRTMQLAPHYHDVVLDVYDALAERIAMCEAAGIEKRNIMIDPGIGFGKKLQHNLELLRQLSVFHALGVGLLLGISRKGFIGALTSETQAAKRIHGSTAGAVQAALQGVHMLRVHDVKATVDSLQVLRGILNPAAIES